MSATPDSHLTPVELSKTDDRRLVIRWSDGVEQSLSFRRLRDGCRCAHCLDQKSKSASPTPGGQPQLSAELPVLSLAETMPLDILRMEPAGNYGYKIQFSDGHRTGIYSFELLRALGDAV